jgi:hypothetical protein
MPKNPKRQTDEITFDCDRSRPHLRALTNRANTGPRGAMTNFGKFSIAGTAPLRAVLAVVFLLMSTLQPGLFATASAKGVHGDKATAILFHEEAASNGHGHDHGHEAAISPALSDQPDKKTNHHGGNNTADKSCEVHCAPSHAVPVYYPNIECQVARCFATVTASILPLGEYAELRRPPRSLN